MSNWIEPKKEELKIEWNNWVAKNTDPYGSAVIDVVVKVCKALDEGKTPSEAEDEGVKDIIDLLLKNGILES